MPTTSCVHQRMTGWCISMQLGGETVERRSKDAKYFSEQKQLRLMMGLLGLASGQPVTSLDLPLHLTLESMFMYLAF